LSYVLDPDPTTAVSSDIPFIPSFKNNPNIEPLTIVAVSVGAFVLLLSLGMIIVVLKQKNLANKGIATALNYVHSFNLYNGSRLSWDR
jgi:hypothetical protein